MRKSYWTTAGSVVGLFAGGVVGYMWPGTADPLEFVGQLYLSALRILVVPLVLAVVIHGLGTLRNGRVAGRTIATGIVYFGLSSAIAVLIGLAAASIIGPGSGVESASLQAPDAVRQAREASLPSLIAALIPGNLPGAVASGRFFGVILLSLVLGTVLATMDQRRLTVGYFFGGLQDALMRLTRWLMYGLPAGLFCIAGAAVARETHPLHSRFGDLGLFFAALAVALLVHGLVVLPILLRVSGQHSPLTLAKHMIPALSTALATGSTLTTYPVTQRCVVRDARTDYRSAAAVLPLGSAVNLNGTAMFVVMAGIFAIQSAGGSLGFLNILTLTGAAWLVTLLSGGFPGAATLMIVVAMDMTGFPEAAFGALALIVATEWLTLRGCAVVDVWSTAVGASIVAKRTADMATRRRPLERPLDRTRVRREGERDRAHQRGRQRGRDFSRDGDRGRRRHEQGDRQQRGQRSRWSRPERSSSGQPAGADSRRSPFEIKASETVELGGISMTTGRSAASTDQAAGADRSDRHSSGRGRSFRRDRSSEASDRTDGSSLEQRPSPRQIERERARVQAQLASLGAGRSTDNAPHEQETPTENTQRSDAGRPHIDFETQDLTAAATDRQSDRSTSESPDEAEREDSVPGSTGEPNGDQNGLEFGRRRMRRPEPSAEPEGGSKPVDMPEIVDEFSSENQAFGRTKKKRPQ